MFKTTHGRMSLKVGAILFAASLALTACGETTDTPAEDDTLAGETSAPQSAANVLLIWRSSRRSARTAERSPATIAKRHPVLLTGVHP